MSLKNKIIAERVSVWTLKGLTLIPPELCVETLNLRTSNIARQPNHVSFRLMIMQSRVMNIFLSYLSFQTFSSLRN